MQSSALRRPPGARARVRAGARAGARARAGAGVGGEPSEGAADVRLRRGRAGDLGALAALVLREKMNPLFLEPSRFVVGVEEDGTLVGGGQIRAVGPPEAGAARLRDQTGGRHAKESESPVHQGCDDRAEAYRPNRRGLHSPQAENFFMTKLRIFDFQDH